MIVVWIGREQTVERWAKHTGLTRSIPLFDRIQLSASYETVHTIRIVCVCKSKSECTGKFQCFQSKRSYSFFFSSASLFCFSWLFFDRLLFGWLVLLLFIYCVTNANSYLANSTLYMRAFDLYVNFVDTYIIKKIQK